MTTFYDVARRGLFKAAEDTIKNEANGEEYTFNAETYIEDDSSCTNVVVLSNVRTGVPYVRKSDADWNGFRTIPAGIARYEESTRGKFIVLEGCDSAGKTTQTNLLIEALEAEGKEVVTYKFPQYATTLGKEIKGYLNGKYGNALTVNPILAGMLYSTDRLLMRDTIINDLKAGKYVIVDRYVHSNAALQAAKVIESQQADIVTFFEELEFIDFKLPVPIKTIFLDVVPSKARYLMDMRKAEASVAIDGGKDQHESNLGYLDCAHGIYSDICDKNDSWARVECMEDGDMRSIEDIHADVLVIVAGAHHQKLP